MNQLIAPFVLLETKRTKIWQSILFSRNFHIIFIHWKPIPSPCYRHPCNRFTENSFDEKKAGVGVGGCRSRILFMVAEVEKKWLGTRLGSNSNENGAKKGWKFERERESPTTNFLFFHQNGQKIPRTQKIDIPAIGPQQPVPDWYRMKTCPPS